MSSLHAPLTAGLIGLGLEASASTVDRLLAYLDLIGRWNRVYNLTAVRDPADMLVQHLLDSLSVVPRLNRRWPPGACHGRRLLDVGSGAGLPGVVIAMLRPDLDVTCVDAVAKKASFIRQAAGELGLKRLQGQHARVETLDQPVFDVVASRAFASLADFVTLTRPSLAPGGAWMAMKGKQPEAEIAALPAGVSVVETETLIVPGLQADRCVVWMTVADV